MEIYTVGGWVRDKLLNPLSTPNDRDYLVVGATHRDIEQLTSKGFTQVGNSFPVFISPEGEEWALARTERKIGLGYQGFSTYSGADVTLEEDLSRRDLTINSMAILNNDESTIVDPFNGLQDLKDKVLRHTSEAFTEDPVRVLRVARFMAKFGYEWSIHPSTLALMQEMGSNGSLYQLQPERVWKELGKALKEPYPELFFRSLSGMMLFPEYDALKDIPQPIEHHPEVCTQLHTDMVVQEAKKISASPEVVFACFCHDLGKVIWYDSGNLHGHEAYGVSFVEGLCKRLKAPKKYEKLATLVTRYHGKIHQVLGRKGQKMMQPVAIMRLLEDTNALQYKERFKDILLACQCDAKGRLGFSEKDYPQKEYLSECLEAVLNVSTKEISIPMVEAGKSGLLIKEAIRVARINAIRGVQKNWQVVTNPQALEEQRAWANGERPNVVRVEFTEEEGLQSFNALLQSKDNGYYNLDEV